MVKHSYIDNYLKSIDADKRSLISEKISFMGERPGKMEVRLDKWLANFSSSEEKALALKLFLCLDYFSEEKINELLEIYKTKISQYLLGRGKTWDDIIIVTPGGHADSSHAHAYKLTKIWRITPGIVLSREQLDKKTIEDKSLIFFNDTHGTGNQFIKEFYDLIFDVGAENCIIVCITVTKNALKLFRKNLTGITVIPEVSTPTLFEMDGFTTEEITLIKKLGNKVYAKHPIGFGDCGLLVAYHFQCPNNNLPIIWANGHNNSYTNYDGDEVQGYPWIYLFEYIPKVKTGSEKKSVRSAKELNDEFKLAALDKIGKNRRKIIRSVLSELEILQPRDFNALELIVRVWKQIFRDAKNRKNFYLALVQTQVAIDELVINASSDKEQKLSLELLAEFAIDFSQYARMYADLNITVSHLNRAIKKLGEQIDAKDISNADILVKSNSLCLRAKCRRALASLYKKRGNKTKEMNKKIRLLRDLSLNDAEKAFDLIRTPTSELEQQFSF